MSDLEHTENATTEDPQDGLASFEEFNLHPEVQESIKKMGFKEPTPVQSNTFREVAGGRSVIIMAQTGTGKTAAFGIPFAQFLDRDKGIQALVLAPTRELALQVAREIDNIGKGRGIKCAAVYGGASFTRQVEEVDAGAQIVVGTPGRVLDHMRRKTIRFDKIATVVLDEADEMLSMGFEKELFEIMSGLPKKKQTLLFSATIPEDIKRLSARYMDDAITISVSGDAIAAKEISHYVYLATGADRRKDLIRLLKIERPTSAIVFCNTKDETQAVSKFMRKAGYNANWINSDLSQAEREKVMADTRKGKVKFLVATDVAARGIDISHLSHVINFSFPEALEIYVHRTGRTGRQGRHGAAVSLITPQDIGNLYFLRLTYKIFPVERTFPASEDEARDQEIDRMETLRKRFTSVSDASYSALARRLMQDLHTERLLAGLLEQYFVGARADKSEPPVETAKPKPEPKPKPKPEPKPEPKPKPKPETKPEPKPKPEPEKKDDEEQGANEIFIGAGRKDGLRISTLMKEIVEITGLNRATVGRVRMLSRSTFVAVPKENFKKVYSALGKIKIGGRKLKFEPAKES